MTTLAARKFNIGTDRPLPELEQLGGETHRGAL
jgi:hypothetical protein